ncbi:MAG: 50S ribosomal protein L6 [Kiritimatiellae bacterium]|nr:50S ribosomal protein L6 [Kiritimatiellia bacterium]MBR4946345.1 50S ribosomal protein L6 [Kiritimatiellia bacterium]MBR5587286.1 50S ribosomal protein L6 [Kiritimatiellia bacterium]
MSRIGKQPITVPAGVTITIANGNEVTVKGPKGELSRVFQKGIEVTVDGAIATVTRANDSLKNFHGLSRTLLKNMIEGVTAGYVKELVIEGTGFKAAVQGNKAILTLGFASPKEYTIPEGCVVTVTADVNVKVEGIDKQVVGEAAARIRSYYPAEPYKGKGIRYKDEKIRRKEGKTVA